MSKQDRQGVRTPADVERKYNLGRLAAAQGSSAQKTDLQQLSETLAQFMADTNGKFQELEGHTQTFFYSGVPTLDNAPAVEWETNEAKAEHIGDLYYNEDDGNLYLFKGDGTDFEWVKCSGSSSGGINARVALAKNSIFEANVQPTATIEEIEG